MSKARRVTTVLLLLLTGVTAWMLTHVALGGSAPVSLTLNPSNLLSQRLEVAIARAAMDAEGMKGAGPESAGYRADFSIARTEIQANSEGLDNWAARAPRINGLLPEVRDSLAGLKTALDQTSGMLDVPTGGTPLLPAVQRAETALRNYSANLGSPGRAEGFPLGARLWWLLVLIWAELTALAAVVFGL